MKAFLFLLKKPHRQAKDCIESCYTRKQLMHKIIVWNHRTTNFAVFDSSDELKDFLLKKPIGERTYSEVILPWRPQKIRLDLDRCNIADLKSIILKAHDTWRESAQLLGQAPPRLRLSIFQSDEDGFHVVLQHYVRDMTVVKNFVKALSEKLTDRQAAIVDRVGQNLRLVGCSKQGGYIKKALTRVTFRDSLISMILD